MKTLNEAAAPVLEKLRASLHEESDETIENLRRLALDIGSDNFLGDMDGDELLALCDAASVERRAAAPEPPALADLLVLGRDLGRF